MEIPYEKQFHFHDGSAIGSLEELKHKIETISYQEFYTHVNNGKNDFANWVQHVLNEEHVAEQLRKVTSIVETVEILNDALHPHTLALPDHTHDSFSEQPHHEHRHKHHVEPEVTEAKEEMTVETVPTTEPAAAHTHSGFTVVEEENAELANPQVREELFHSTPIERPRENPQPAAKETTGINSDIARMIVKDFMYGFIFGLIVGVLLGKILAF